MSEGSAASPGDWRSIDRRALADLLSSGLTPDQVGFLFARSGDSVRLLARRWDLDCRALRARAIGLAAQHPDIAAQFVAVVDGAPPGHGPSDLLTGSGARCRWRCPECDEVWVTSVANRTKRRSGCPACARRRGVDAARARPARTTPLAAASGDVVREFVRNLTRPDRDAGTTPSGSHDRVLWRCRSGHEWETSARQRVRHRTQCPTCLRGLWSSRLEYQVAELVHVATGLAVVVGGRRPRADRAAPEHVDLLVEEADVLIDLDPTRWHRDPEAVARDRRKLVRLAGERYVRVRPRRLGLLPAAPARPEQQILLTGTAEGDPWLWAAAVITALQRLWSPTRVQVVDASVRRAALARADLQWRRLRSGSRERSLLSEFPAVAHELVEVVGRPGLTAADLAPSGDDRARWRCSQCGHEWEARVANRTVSRTGCPPCSHRRVAARAARPGPGESFADLHPELVPYFVRNETSPGRTLHDLRPNSVDSCRWTCPHCAHPWRVPPRTLHRRPGAGCSRCAARRSGRTRRERRRPGPAGAPSTPCTGTDGPSG